MAEEEQQTAPGRRFASLLKHHRLKRELTHEDLVAQTGVSLNTISRWERGLIRNPVPAQLKAVCRAVGLSPVTAWIALGALDPEDVEDVPEPPAPLSPAEEAAIAIIRDPGMSDEDIRMAVNYLTFLRQQRQAQAGEGEARAS